MSRNAVMADQFRQSAVSDSKDRLRLWLKLLKASRRVEAELRENFRTEFDFTLPRFDVLAALGREQREMRMSELSSTLKVSNGNVTGIVDRLVADGQLQRVAVPGDRRATCVRLTASGEELFRRAAAAHEGWIDRLLGEISAEEARLMMGLLSRIVDGSAARERL
jgi:DNA-binding MarR family transcriptional regulator